MKKSVFFVCVFIALNSSYVAAQANRGRVLLGVSSALNMLGKGSELMSYNHSTTKQTGSTNEGDGPEKQSTLGLAPKAGYFLSDNLVLGLDLSLFSIRNKWDSSTEKSRIIAAGPFLRYYFKPGKVQPFLELNGLIGSVVEEYESTFGSSSETINLSAIGGGIGIAAPVGDKVAFDIMLGYNNYRSKNKEDTDGSKYITGSFGLKLGFTIFPGSN